MNRLLAKLDRRFSQLTEMRDDFGWKNPVELRAYADRNEISPGYHALRAIAGPCTPHPVWAMDWTAPNSVTYRKGEPAPRWTDEEIHLAMAPQIMTWARNDTRGAYAGGHGARTDQNRVQDAAQNMHLELQKMLEQEIDQGRILSGGGFVSWVTVRVRQAGKTGVGGTKETIRTRGRVEELLKAKRPEDALDIANRVGEEYRTNATHKRDESNPFGKFSPQMYKLGIDLSQALQTGDRQAVEQIRNQLRELLVQVDDAETLIQGSGTGRRDISTPHGAKKGGEAEADLAGFYKTKIASVDTPVGDGTDTLGSRIAGDHGIEMGKADVEVIYDALKMGRDFAKSMNPHYDKNVRELERCGLRPIEDGDFRYLIRYLTPFLPGKYPYEGVAGKDPEMDPKTGEVSDWIKRDKEPWATDRASIINDIVKGGPGATAGGAVGGGASLVAITGGAKLTPTESETLELMLGLSPLAKGPQSQAGIAKLRGTSKVSVNTQVKSIVKKTGKTIEDMLKMAGTAGAAVPAQVQAGPQLNFSNDPMSLFKRWVQQYQAENDELDESRSIERRIIVETLQALNRLHFYLEVYPFLSGRPSRTHRIRFNSQPLCLRDAK